MKTRTGSWIYYDARRVKTNFVIISKSSLEVAYTQIKFIGTFRLYLLILERVNGRTASERPDGYRLGEMEIRERTGLSRSGLYRAMGELTELGFIERVRIGKTTRASLSVASRNQDAPKKDASQNRDALTALHRSEKPADSEPIEKKSCVPDPGPIPIPYTNYNSPSSPSHEGGEEQAKKRKKKDTASIPRGFQRIVQEEIDAIYQNIEQYDEMSHLLGHQALAHHVWESILRQLRKSKGMDGLHHRGYPMGSIRKKAIMLDWIQTICIDHTREYDWWNFKRGVLGRPEEIPKTEQKEFPIQQWLFHAHIWISNIQTFGLRGARDQARKGTIEAPRAGAYTEEQINAPGTFENSSSEYPLTFITGKMKSQIVQWSQLGCEEYSKRRLSTYQKTAPRGSGWEHE
tara:strand:+ start:526 stop:1734 length:1209 start_codon:yes stop_codon:yes gene_type:complete